MDSVWRTTAPGLDPAQILGDEAVREQVLQIVRELPVEQAAINALIMRFGLDTGEERNEERIATLLQISLRQCERLIALALQALRDESVIAQIRALLE